MLALAAASVCLAGSPAHAAEEYVPVRRDATIVLEGKGAGHGVGMSQYGAKRGAELGRTAPQILSAYYPGATLSTGSTTSLRIAITRWDQAATCTSTPATATPCLQVRTEAGQVVVDRASGARLAVPTSISGAPVTAVAVGASATGLRVWALAGSWQRLSGTDFAGPVDIVAPDNAQTITIGGKDYGYRGSIRVVKTSDTTIRRINVVGVEDYLLGVVPSEMPAEWPTAAVQAQAVAARTYALANASWNASSTYDLCDTTACQVYGGISTEESAATTKIRSATPADVRGKILTANGGIISAFFSASNGGYTTAGGTGYLPARADAWDPATGWTRIVSGSCLSAKYGKGTFNRLVITSRDGRGSYGGRVTGLRLEFSGGTVSVTPAATPMGSDSRVRSAFAGCGSSGIVSSSMFRGVPEPNPPRSRTLNPGWSSGVRLP